MSVTCAISGISAAGGMLTLGNGLVPTNQPETLAALAVALSAVNIVGGFRITHRMLDMFRKPADPDEHLRLYGIPAGVLGGGYLALHAVGLPHMDQLAYAYSSLLMLGGIGGLSSMSSARFGNMLGMIGVCGGLATTLGVMNSSPQAMLQAAGLLGIGAAAGSFLGGAVKPFQLPQMVAMFGSLGSFAAMVTSIASYQMHPGAGAVHSGAAMMGDFIGGVTFTGSLVAFGKLHALLPSKSLNLPSKNMLNVGMLASQGVLAATFFSAP